MLSRYSPTLYENIAVLRNGLSSSELNWTDKLGKSEISRRIIAFSLTFLPLYVKIPHARFYATLCSFKQDTASDQLLKSQPAILDAINTFNSIYPNSKLQYDCVVKEKGRNRKLKWNSNIIEINRDLKKETVSYSALDVLGLDSKASNPGYTSHFLYVDRFVHNKPIFMLGSLKVAWTTT